MTQAEHQGKRPRLSVAMLVRDAADLLGEAIEGVRSIADEIVIADLGSTDGSLEIARQAADVLLEIEWQDSFAAARNACAKRATGDWILWLEADERLEDSAAQQLRNFVDEAADANKAYMLFIQRPSPGAAGGNYEQLGQLRLLPGGRELRFTGRIREQILLSVKEAGLGVDALDCALRRVQERPNTDWQRAAARQRLNLANLSLTEDGEQAGALVARAEALAELGRAKEAAAVYRRVLGVAERGSSEMLEAYYGLLSAMDADAAAAEQQMATCLEALSIYPLDAQLLCGMGSYLLRAQRLDLAGRSYEMAVVHGKVDPSIWHLAALADVAVVCWSLVLQLSGETERAEAVLNDALRERPESPRLRRPLIELLIKGGREREAIAHCEELPANLPHRKLLPQVVRGAVLAATQKPAEALGPLRAAYQAGCRDTLCLRWLAGAQLALGKLEDVAVTCTEWERHEPANLEIAAFRRAIEQRRGRPASAVPEAGNARRVDGGAIVGPPITAPLHSPGTTALPR